MLRRFLLVVFILTAAAAWIVTRPEPLRVEAAPAFQDASSDNGLRSTMVGHETRQDDLPGIAVAPDGTVWTTWLSYVGDRDDIAIRHSKNGKWGTLQWVPGSTGDNWMPQVGVDAANRVWVVWSQQAPYPGDKGNWDIYARRFDPAKLEWGTLERLSNDPLPDLHPRLTSDGKGRLAVVWQGFRAKNSNIFLRTLEGDRWSNEIRVTNRAANDWEPAVALDATGAAHVVYDTYQNGNYDIGLVKVANGVAGAEQMVASTRRFEARATVAVDTGGRVWVAYEQGNANWGKDQGYIVRDRKTGVQLGGQRQVRVKVLDAGVWKEPAGAHEALSGAGVVNSHQPHIYADSQGSVWLVARPRVPAETRKKANQGSWEYRAIHLEGGQWSAPVVLPNSKGRSSTRMGGALAKDGSLWVAWDSHNPQPQYAHRPLRQQVFAASLPARAAAAPELRAANNDDVPSPGGHANEAADLKAIRSYTANGWKIVRGDFHRHTELSWDGGGAGDGSLLENYRYFIDAAGMDFGASTDHQGGLFPYWWWYSQKMTDMFHAPGAFAPIFGYERSATYPNGHRNVFFARRVDSRVTPWHLKPDSQGFQLPVGPQGDEPGVGTGELVENDTKLLYEDVRPRKGLVISHTSGTRMGTDWRDNDPALEPVVEIFQGARTNYERADAPHAAQQDKDGPHVKQAGYQPLGFMNHAWGKGYKLGIIASSDHGSTHISYAMVYTADTSRQGILDAIHKRHTYGAMDNIILDVRMGRWFMGDEFALTKPQPISIRVRGTKPIAMVEVIKDSQVIYSAAPKTQDVKLEYTDKGDVNGRHYYYVRVRQEDSLLAWSSPFFINYK